MTYEIDLESWQARIVALESASEVGRRILTLLLEDGPMSAGQISRRLGIPLTTAFYHLARMELVNLVESDIKITSSGPRWVKYYRASSSRIVFNLERR